MNERIEEINLALTAIEQICQTASISLSVIPENSAKMIIVDATNGKAYNFEKGLTEIQPQVVCRDCLFGITAPVARLKTDGVFCNGKVSKNYGELMFQSAKCKNGTNLREQLNGEECSQCRAFGYYAENKHCNGCKIKSFQRD